MCTVSTVELGRRLDSHEKNPHLPASEQVKAPQGTRCRHLLGTREESGCGGPTPSRDCENI